MSTSTRRLLSLETLGLMAVALAATYPLFIDTYRTMAFQTVPRDDYAPYLLYLVGQGGEIPGAPRAYRLFSVAAAVPAYLMLPTFRFSRLSEVDPAYLKATLALAFVSWIALAALGVLTYRIARDRLGASRPASLAVMFATLLFARYTSIVGVDPIALLLIAAACYWFARPWLFAAVVILSVGFNEKVWIVATLLVAARALYARALRAYRVHLLACALAVLAYAGSVQLFKPAGPERPSLGRPFVTDAPRTLRMTASLKGVAQNVAPVVLLVAACAWSAHVLRGYSGRYFSPWDAAVPLGLAAIGISMSVEYTLGRLAFHAIPIVIPPLALALDRSGAATDAIGPPHVVGVGDKAARAGASAQPKVFSSAVGP